MNTKKYKSTVDEAFLKLTEDQMRKKLQFFFMNPIQKWHAKQRFPFKFSVQLVKIILVTLQLWLFSSTAYNHVNYTADNRITFSHLFLMNWDATREVNAYPPSIGPLAVYKIKDFYDTVEYAYKSYLNLSEAVGSYSYANEDNSPEDMVLCLYSYKEGIIYGFNESYVFNNEVVKECFNISTSENGNTLNLKDLQSRNNWNISFSALVRAELIFSVKTVNFKAASRITSPNCYKFDIKISFNNEDHDGQILVELDAESIRLKCKGVTTYIANDTITSILRTILNVSVCITCIISLVLCVRTVWRAQQLKNVTVKYFKKNFGKELKTLDSRKFLNLWYIMIIVNDIFIIIGSIIKEQIERQQLASDEWIICSLFLGVGNMLVWFGILRYLGFFKTYNIVILTLEKAAPTVARFLLCAVLIYAGFTFCGWLVLGPYHLKFRTLSTTSECLFSLINGDDMFATFSIMAHKSQLLWWFSRVYLYSFISLFIYVILNLFISVITDAYETIKLCYSQGFPQSDLDEFMGNTNREEVHSGVYRSGSSESLGGLIKDLCCCIPQLNKSYRTFGHAESSLHSQQASQS